MSILELRPAEEWAEEKARELAMDSAHIPAIKSQLVPQYRQIQANVLRWAASESHSRESRDFLTDKANQLDPEKAA